MNNYCTNCGKKLKEKEYYCTTCGTPIISLPKGYIPPAKRKKRKKILKSTFYIMIIITIIIVTSLLRKYILINNLEKNYIIPYLQKNYPDQNSTIKYEKSGRCIISGNCYFDPVFGCDGGWCEEYKYLSRFECKSYYFTVTNDNNEEFILTIVKRNDEIYVVKGINIFGKDETKEE